MLKTMGGEVVYEGSVEANNPDVKPRCCACRRRARKANHALDVNAGFLSRLINTRAEMNWDVPIVARTTLAQAKPKPC